MNLILDIGNTQTKIAVYQHNKQMFYERISHNQTDNEIERIVNKFSPEKAIVSNVSAYEPELSKFKNLDVLNFSHQTPLPLKIKYKTPETLGLDRIALTCGAAYHHSGNKNILIIDAGTCITYDFVNENKEYLGGAISPGLSMRLKAMHHFTGKLPFVDFSENALEPPFVGQSTKECLISGAFWGLIMEINGNIHRYEEQFGNLYVFLTGGDANKFEKHLKNRIFANPFLLTDGLNYILEFNS